MMCAPFLFSLICSCCVFGIIFHISAVNYSIQQQFWVDCVSCFVDFSGGWGVQNSAPGVNSISPLMPLIAKAATKNY